ncbi:MAG: L-2-amino-thiazoline-4-carboxylic acid hydrolase [Oscillospiraceae bacterium]
MDRDYIAEYFDIPHHAILFALIYRSAFEALGDDGADACDEGTKLYGLERGGRMAQRALANGDELTMRSYLLYGEWEDKNELSASEVDAYTPVYKSSVTRCGWCKAWEENGLLEYGKNYCNFVDKYLVKGFNQENKININSTLSHGEECCAFEWLGFSLSNADEKREYAMDKARLADSVTKDFLYHSGHLLSAMTRALEEHLSQHDAQSIIAVAMADFNKLYGDEMTQALLKESQKDFTYCEE